LIMDGTLDIHFISKLEQKMEGKARFTRVDADVIDKLIQKGNEKMVTLTTDQQNALTSIFSSKLPNDSKMNFIVTYENLDANSLPVYITQNEFMRRMKEMSATGGGMGFYGNMPDSYNLVVNTAHPLIEKILKDEEAQCGEKVNPLTSSVAELEKKRTDLKGDKKESDLAEAIKDEVKDLDNKINDAKNQQKEILAGYAKDSKEVSQLVDLALLSNNLLKGEALSNFIKRSMSML